MSKWLLKYESDFCALTIAGTHGYDSAQWAWVEKGKDTGLGQCMHSECRIQG